MVGCCIICTVLEASLKNLVHHIPGHSNGIKSLHHLLRNHVPYL